jgi:galactose mutarotase-like enzyme
MYELSNDQLSIVISSKGAELQSIYGKYTGIEYMWSGNPAFWGKKSPVLFPIVGGLKNNRYTYQGKEYVMGRHGFARDRVFTISKQTDSSVTYSLKSDEETRSIYPFDFIFSINYQLIDNKVKVSYQIENTGEENMYCSVGAHPAFAVPLIADMSFEDHYLAFEQPENAPIWPLSNEGLILEQPTDFFQQENKIALRKTLFYGDALVFKSLQSKSISILSDKHPHGIKVSYENFPFMGIWSAKDADFVCIEPWCGIADAATTDGELMTKEGIHQLLPKTMMNRSWTIEVF